MLASLISHDDDSNCGEASGPSALTFINGLYSTTVNIVADCYLGTACSIASLRARTLHLSAPRGLISCGRSSGCGERGGLGLAVATACSKLVARAAIRLEDQTTRASSA